MSVTKLKPRREVPAHRYVYFIEAQRLGLVKIGCANDPRERLASLQVGSPDRLVLRGVLMTDDAPALEAHIHREFDDLRSHGEWFQVDSGLERVMANLTTVEEMEASPAIIQMKPSPANPKARHYDRLPGESDRRFLKRIAADLRANPYYTDKGEQVVLEDEAPRGLPFLKPGAVAPPLDSPRTAK